MSARQRRRRENRRRRHSETIPARRRLIVATGMTAGATLAMSGVANAAPETFTVGSSADTTGAVDCTTATNTDCTLRQAILDANANTGADTIVFKASLSGSTVTLTTDPVQILEAVDIQGPGGTPATIDGAGSYRDFNIDLDTAHDLVSISGLTITDGYAGTGSGGAVSNYNADLTISNSVISDSYATDIPSQGRGGGVYTNLGTLTINSSTVSGNHAYYGGGIGTMDGHVTVNSSTITGNSADGDTASSGRDGYGGGINSYDAQVDVNASTVAGNNAAYDGGGIYSDSGDLTVTNSTITGNNAVNDDGGGVYVGNGELDVTSSTVTDNYAATFGGGLRGTGPVNTIRNSIVSGNTAAGGSDTDDLAYDQFDTAFSLVGVPASHVNTTVPSSNLLGVNPQIGPLQDNGGPTETMEPGAASPVIDCGSDTVNPLDQRGTGFPRVVDQPNRTGSTATGANNADMGAVEVAANSSITGACANNPPPAPTPSGPTGQRSAALSKCKRKHKKAVQNRKKQDALTQPVKKNLNKKFKKCKRKANQLPI